MSEKRIPEEFKIEAVKQLVDRGYKLSEVTDRFGVITKIMHNWIERYGSEGTHHQTG
ncbi:MAG: transposase [Cellvibrionaceae bacterium]|jgi:transposase